MVGIRKVLPPLFFILSLVCAVSANAAIINVANCSQSAVQTAINSASNGDTVQIPNGSCAWSSPVSISNKALTLKGNGFYAVNANHEDTGTWPLTITLSGNNGIEISGSESQYIRVTGIHFTGSCPGGTSQEGAVKVTRYNMTGNWRVDNCRFSVIGNSVHCDTAGLGGLIDHIYAYNSGCSNATQVTTSDIRNSSNGDWIFTQPVGFGSSNFVFIEGSTFWRNCSDSSPATTATDTQAGGKFVFRYNYVRDAMVIWHGTESGAPERGGYAFEMYNNEFYWTISNNRYHTAIFHRGGTALVYNNTATNYQALWKSDVRRSTGSYGIFGQCDGTQVHDGNWGGSYPPGYPCLDQVGRGTATGASLSTVQPQAESKVYIWGNTRINTGTVFHNQPTYVVQGRDYEFCDGTSCAPAGYIPYPYPHALVTGGDQIRPGPPVNPQQLP